MEQPEQIGLRLNRMAENGRIDRVLLEAVQEMSIDFDDFRRMGLTDKALALIASDAERAGQILTVRDETQMNATPGSYGCSTALPPKSQGR